MASITDIKANIIPDSRGKETLEVKIITDEGVLGVDSVPSGTSTGSFEAVAIEPKQAIRHINEVIAPKLIGQNPVEQEKIDSIMLELDGTENKSKLGANAILGVSLAVSRTGAISNKMPLYWHLNKLLANQTGVKIEPSIPTPMMVMIEGGKHGDNNLCIQEFLVISTLDNGKKIWTRLKDVLAKKNLEAKICLEGGFTPKLPYDEDAFQYILEAIEAEKLNIVTDVKLGLDVAANHCEISHEDILSLFNRYPIYSIEDPIAEDRWHEWAQLKLELDQTGKQYLLVGDDLFVTNSDRLKKGINNLVANAIIIKLNQVGTLTETLEVIASAKKAGFTHILSHRSGETLDTYIADLAVGTGAKYLKSGAPFASERVVKYNRLTEIQGEL